MVKIYGLTRAAWTRFAAALFERKAQFRIKPIGLGIYLNPSDSGAVVKK